ncbi:hypothetical protein [Mycolicibacterium sarraceniae]|uniref:Uncharacterized protein n=1 Tax=Mycolicibacterium sarraceniae TaxID=1534348 RepID=A0A7I7SV55_9MYCO|nr:hypothetical protein [Mycolicibacterium sarraceniae]BBY59716.1 hypothetical protein MSAR_28520 [Mycolicibacterium sarraceniae]
MTASKLQQALADKPQVWPAPASVGIAPTTSCADAHDGGLSSAHLGEHTRGANTTIVPANAWLIVMKSVQTAYAATDPKTT